MDGPLDADLIDQLTTRLREPTWLAHLRQGALAKHAELPWPHPSDDIWRRTDVALLDPARQGCALAPPSLLQAVPVSQAHLAALTQPLGQEQLCVRVNGSWLTPPSPEGLLIEELAEAAWRHPEPLRRMLEADGLTPAEQKLTTLNGAFHHDDVVLQVPANVHVGAPVRLVHVTAAAAKHALFPLTIITVGAGSEITLIDEYVSLEPDGTTEPHVVNSRIELWLEPEAKLHYVRLQRWGAHAREFVVEQAQLSQGASLTMANITLGAALSKAHLITRLSGEHASTRVYGFVFGHHQQHIDQHTLQDHLAPHTTSDLQFKAALQDQSRMIYTGLIRIAKQAQQTQAFQANHNLLLSSTARAETIPMLEILADDVQCKHGASISPIDEEQAFYLMSRGVPRSAAERLIVLGFVESVIQQVPFAPLQERLRDEIAGSLHE